MKEEQKAPCKGITSYEEQEVEKALSCYQQHRAIAYQCLKCGKYHLTFAV